MFLDSPNLYLSSFSFSAIVQGTTGKELLKVFTNVDIRRCIFENCPKKYLWGIDVACKVCWVLDLVHILIEKTPIAK